MNWEQLKTIFWLRWRLTRNQWARSGGLGAVLAAVIAVAAVMLGGASFVGGLLGGAMGLGEAKPQVLMGIWFAVTVGFLFFWFIGLISELQRSETIDLQRLMHLPIALGQMFVVNYAASHLALSIILFVPAMTGLALGLTYSRGLTMLLLLPLAASMVFMVTAWTYCLRGWLATGRDKGKRFVETAARQLRAPARAVFALRRVGGAIRPGMPAVLAAIFAVPLHRRFTAVASRATLLPPMLQLPQR